MTIFKSRQVNLDPAPWRAIKGGVRTSGSMVEGLTRIGVEVVLDPRPEFEPTRDPEPYLILGERSATPADFALFAPRREQFDTPVNPILVAMRDDYQQYVGTPGAVDRVFWESWLERLPRVKSHGVIASAHGGFVATAEQIDHARRVLTRLANFTS